MTSFTQSESVMNGGKYVFACRRGGPEAVSSSPLDRYSSIHAPCIEGINRVYGRRRPDEWRRTALNVWEGDGIEVIQTQVCIEPIRYPEVAAFSFVLLVIVPCGLSTLSTFSLSKLSSLSSSSKSTHSTSPIDPPTGR